MRDAVVACVQYWSARARLTVKQLLSWLGIPSSKYYHWSNRYGQPNQHNAQLPRVTWLQPWERQAILDYEQETVNIRPEMYHPCSPILHHAWSAKMCQRDADMN